MFRVIYTSRLAPGVDKGDLAQIEREGTANNNEQGINSVILLVDENTVIQGLEGSPRAGRQLIERLWDDPRHRKCEGIHTEVGASPIFNDMPLRVVRLEDLTQDKLAADQGIRWMIENTEIDHPIIKAAKKSRKRD